LSYIDTVTAAVGDQAPRQIPVDSLAAFQGDLLPADETRSTGRWTSRRQAHAEFLKVGRECQAWAPLNPCALCAVEGRDHVDREGSQIGHRHAAALAQLGEDVVTCGGILDGHAAQGAVLWIQRGFPELLGIHFAQTLVALDIDA
jgi:hypothetical protein